MAAGFKQTEFVFLSRYQYFQKLPMWVTASSLSMLVPQNNRQVIVSSVETKSSSILEPLPAAIVGLWLENVFSKEIVVIARRVELMSKKITREKIKR